MMTTHRLHRAAILGAAAAAAAVLASTACSRPVGSGPDSDARVTPDSQVGVDARVDDPDAARPDAGELIDMRGWRSEAFEHSGFVPEANVDEAALDRCEPYLMAAEGQETWWTEGGAWEDLLPFFPYVGGTERIALMTATGYLSPSGTYGYDGFYQREFDIQSWEIHACETVARLGHCVVPRTEDYCFTPEPELYEGLEKNLVRILPGPNGQESPYELSVVYNPNVADGVTIFRLDFTLPYAPTPDAGDWDVFEVNELLALTVTEIREWFYYQEVPFPNAHDGWVLRHRESDTLLVSISAEDASDRYLHLWGTFPVTEVIAYP